MPRFAMRISAGEAVIIVMILGLTTLGVSYWPDHNAEQDATISVIARQMAENRRYSILSDERTKTKFDALDQQIAELARIVGRWKP